MGAGESMSVGEEVAVDGCDAVGTWAGDDECEVVWAGGAGGDETEDRMSGLAGGGGEEAFGPFMTKFSMRRRQSVDTIM